MHLPCIQFLQVRQVSENGSYSQPSSSGAYAEDEVPICSCVLQLVQLEPTHHSSACQTGDQTIQKPTLDRQPIVITILRNFKVSELDCKRKFLKWDRTCLQL